MHDAVNGVPHVAAVRHDSRNVHPNLRKGSEIPRRALEGAILQRHDAIHQGKEGLEVPEPIVVGLSSKTRIYLDLSIIGKVGSPQVSAAVSVGLHCSLGCRPRPA